MQLWGPKRIYANRRLTLPRAARVGDFRIGARIVTTPGPAAFSVVLRPLTLDAGPKEQAMMINRQGQVVLSAMPLSHSGLEPLDEVFVLQPRPGELHVLRADLLHSHLQGAAL